MEFDNNYNKTNSTWSGFDLIVISLVFSNSLFSLVNRSNYEQTCLKKSLNYVFDLNTLYAPESIVSPPPYLVSFKTRDHTTLLFNKVTSKVWYFLVICCTFNSCPWIIIHSPFGFHRAACSLVHHILMVYFTSISQLKEK